MGLASSISLEIATRTDVGKIRPHNEDSVFANQEVGLVVLADGMGGYNAGEVASSMATTLLGSGLMAAFAERRPDDPANLGKVWAQEALAHEIACTNEVIHEAAVNQPQYAGMGTTVVAAVFYDDRLTVAHVGDSRMYRWRDDVLELITHDHSLLQEQIDDGIITLEQAKQSNSKGLLTRAIGVDPVVDAELRDHDVRAGDIFLACSDGLTDMVDVDGISATLSALGEFPDECAARLVALANENGGRDNVTVAVVKVGRTTPMPQSWWARLKAWLVGQRGQV